ncbi:MAG: hypothetical protein QM791_09135 [Ferruginibacter sp.]
MYTRSLKRTGDRKLFLQSAIRVVLFLPAGLQALLILGCIFLHFIPVSEIFTGSFQFDFTGKEEQRFFVTNDLKIILAASLFLTGNLWLIKKAQYFNGIINVLVFTAGIAMLISLLQNLQCQLWNAGNNKPVFDYSNSVAFTGCLLLITGLSFIKGAWIYKKESDLLKYYVLSSRYLLCYGIAIAVKMLFTIFLLRIFFST